MKNILRVFPRKTKATPIDDYVKIGYPDLFTFEKNIDEVHISCTFSFDKKECDNLYKEYSKYHHNVKIGGVAYGDSGSEFIPGMYLKKGYIITSRGCPNECWFCDVWKREGKEIRELEIKEGYNILDSNLLACSDEHIKKVFAMLETQNKNAEFTGGIEAARLKDWHVKLFKSCKPAQIFFAYDTDNDKEPLCYAGELFKKYNLYNIKKCHVLRCYVLIGYKKDTFEKAESRLIYTIKAGFMPMAMLYRDKENNEPSKEWKRFQREWANPFIVGRKIKDILNIGD